MPAYARASNPHFEEIAKAAQDAWENREMANGYILVQSHYPKDIRGAIGHLMVREGLDTEPVIVSSISGAVIFVQHVSTAITDHLMKTIKGNTFTFGKENVGALIAARVVNPPHLKRF